MPVMEALPDAVLCVQETLYAAARLNQATPGVQVSAAWLGEGGWGMGKGGVILQGRGSKQ